MHVCVCTPEYWWFNSFSSYFFGYVYISTNRFKKNIFPIHMCLHSMLCTLTFFFTGEKRKECVLLFSAQGATEYHHRLLEWMAWCGSGVLAKEIKRVYFTYNIGHDSSYNFFTYWKKNVERENRWMATCFTHSLTLGMLLPFFSSLVRLVFSE